MQSFNFKRFNERHVFFFIGTEFSSAYCRLLLTPHLTEAIPMSSSRPTFAPTSANPHSLGLLIQHLKECVEGYVSAMEVRQGKSRKLVGGALGMEDVRMVSGRVHSLWLAVSIEHILNLPLFYLIKLI